MEISKKQIKEMERNAYINMVSEILDRKLNIYSGTKQKFTVFEESAYFYKVVDIRWKGDIHFEVETSKGYGWYFVSRDKQRISNLYHFNKIDDNVIIRMQQLIQDIENGRYNGKQTLKEQIVAVVEKRGLTGYMNATKWKELINEIGTNLREISFMYKTLFDENEPQYFWSLAGDEYIQHMNTAVIEWIKINPIHTEYEHQGALLADKIHTHSLESELVSILKKYNIPYEYVKDEKVYIIYGYK